ncbi:hypothetical protein BGP75_07240 [Motiliproteus sp. MSK22-1]|nr:hypothetical protein BGP75_07240 [Motiliproteus sp. MSK22-1]
MMEQVKRSSSQFEISADRIRESLGRWDQQINAIWENISNQRGWNGFGELLGWFGLMVLSGLVLEKTLGWRLQKLGDNIANQSTDHWLTILCYMLLRLLFNLVRVGVFALGALIVPMLVTDADSPWRTALLAMLGVIFIVRLIAVLGQAVFAPTARGIRPLALNCHQASNIYWWVLAFSLYYALLINVVELLTGLGLEPIMVQLIVPVGGLVMNLMVNVFVWTHRHTITQLFSDDESADSNLKQIIVQAWPVLVSMWLLTLWLIWGYAIFTGDFQAADKLTISWWITLLFPLVDRLFYVLLSNLVQLRWLQSPRFEQRSKRFRQILQNGLRLMLVAFAVFSLAEGWGYQTMAMMEAGWVQNLLRALLDIVVIILVAFITWELIQSAIERRLPEPVEQETESPEGEGGGGGASRTETLLPLMRSFILAVLVVTVVLSILSSIGVEIAPLLAGAGVVGIAIGFGAQKLVADIISGVFFLLDDAFRRGEYIEAANMRGTVENISIRSMRLRHHLGAVQTVPYSEISTVKNLSRDWVTMKLEFRLPYDTDVEKVRKIIKKIGLAMMEDEEIGPNLILPLKSQGVMRVEESALIFRMKFTSKPGEQWVIRREAYTRVKAGLEKNGIHFAHRSVHVLMPQDLENEKALTGNEVNGSSIGPSAEKASNQLLAGTSVTSAVAAASVTSAIAADLNRQAKLDQEAGSQEDDR